jgi:hypothetical protein
MIKYSTKKGNEMNYTWIEARGADVNDIVALAETHFQNEIDLIFTPQPLAYSRNLTYAVVNQFYSPGSDLVIVARDDSNKLIAYTWAKNGERSWWSDDPMVSVHMAHVNMDLSPKLRIRLVNDMLDSWEQFATSCGTPIICSTTMRHDQDGFLKLHSRRGYSVRGSFAYKRLTLTQATPAN